MQWDARKPNGMVRRPRRLAEARSLCLYRLVRSAAVPLRLHGRWGLAHRHHLRYLLYTHGLASSYLEGANFFDRGRFHSADSMGHSLLLLWGPEAQGDFVRWCQIGGLWSFVRPARRFRSDRLHAASVRSRPTGRPASYNANRFFCFPSRYSSSVFLMYPLGQSSWFFAPSFGVAAIFRFLLFFQGFHNWTLNPFHMMGVAGVLGGALLCAITVPPWRTPCLRMVRTPTPSGPFRTDPRRKRPTLWSPPTGSGLRFSALPSPNKRWLHFFMLFVPVTGLWMSAVGVVGLGLNLRAYDFVSQEIRAAEDPRI